MRVPVLDTTKKPLAPTTPRRARLLLKSGKAAVFRRYPFTIILKREIENPTMPDLKIKIDPGSRSTGVAIVNQQTGDIVKANIPNGKFAGRHVGRLSAVRQRPSFTLNGFDVHPKHLKRIHRSDGFNYQMKTVGRTRETRKALAHLHCAAGGGGSFIAPVEQIHSKEISP